MEWKHGSKDVKVITAKFLNAFSLVISLRGIILVKEYYNHLPENNIKMLPTSEFKAKLHAVITFVLCKKASLR